MLFFSRFPSRGVPSITVVPILSSHCKIYILLCSVRIRFVLMRIRIKIFFLLYFMSLLFTYIKQKDYIQFWLIFMLVSSRFFLLLGSGSAFPEVDLDPAKWYGSNRIRNTASMNRLFKAKSMFKLDVQEHCITINRIYSTNMQNRPFQIHSKLPTR